MAKKTVVVQLLEDTTTGQVVAGYKAEDMAGLPDEVTFHENQAISLGALKLTTLKKDPASARAGELLRPLWELATCDIIK